MTAVAAPNPYPPPGEVIDGKYRIEKVLGEGGMGCVSRATHLILRSTVALKFMNPQFTTFPGAVDRFINEGIASKRIKSAHVVPVDDVGKLPSGAPYLVMPCLEGVDLADLLLRDGTPGLPTTRAIHFTIQILRGLQAAHAAGIIHRDMKPSNCFVVKHEGEQDFVRILDFGISKVKEPGSASLTQTNSALGTPLYMSPEQARSPRDVDGRSDLYSVGVILYELLTGHTPFFSESGEFTEILFKLFTAEPPPVKSTRPDLDDALAAVVHKALAREPGDRFASAAEMALALAPFADARSAALVGRIKSFQPEQALSLPPPAEIELPPSMVAFSQLDARPATGVMANRPTTDVMAGTPMTVVMDGAPGMRPRAPTNPDAQAVPLDASLRARPDEAANSTQMDFVQRGSASMPVAGADLARVTPNAVAITGARSDLEASRDAAAAAADASSERKRPPVAFLGFAAVGVAGVVFLAVGMTKGAGKTGPGGMTAEAPTVTATTTAPPVETVTPPTLVGSAVPVTSGTPTAANAPTGSGAPTASSPAVAVSAAHAPGVPGRTPAVRTTTTTTTTPGADPLDLGIKR